MSYSIEFTLPGLPSTTNSSGRKHWAIKAKEVRQWKNMVIITVGTRKPKEPLQKARLTLTRVSSSVPDADGLVSSFKSCVDGLVSCGVLIDDKMKNIGMPDYRHEIGKPGQGFIRIKVEEL